MPVFPSGCNQAIRKEKAKNNNETNDPNEPKGSEEILLHPNFNTNDPPFVPLLSPEQKEMKTRWMAGFLGGVGVEVEIYVISSLVYIIISRFILW